MCMIPRPLCFGFSVLLVVTLPDPGRGTRDPSITSGNE